jgi:NAD(P)-dependent dehydrogenase (short-subunit alcohol dehydrogenase family)
MRSWLITGVSVGLGRALAEHALDRGDVVVGTVRRADQAAEFEQVEPGRSHAEILDVTDTDAAVAATVTSAIGKAGHLDVVVNNAGYGLAGAVEEVSESEARHQMETNFFGPLKVVRAVLPHLRARRAGHIVNVSSAAGFRGTFGLGLYNASKFALEGLSEALRAELSPLGISVTIVEPGATRTRWSGASLAAAANMIDDYELPRKMRAALASLDGNQPGDPRKTAAAIYAVVDSQEPRLRLITGTDALYAVNLKMASVAADIAFSIAAMSADVSSSPTLSLSPSRDGAPDVQQAAE